MQEFDLIQLFQQDHSADSSIIVPSGDDAAVVKAPLGHELVFTIDALHEGIHFPHDTPAHAVGYKSLAVSISDIAAMGAKPKWAVATLTLPEVDKTWCKAFADGFLECAAEFGVSLIGGDITRGPLSVVTQLTGIVPSGCAILQSTAKPNQDIYVTGMLGSGAAGLANKSEQTRQKLYYPTPRVEIASRLQGLATAMIDLSDSLSQDLTRLCQRSGVGAKLDFETIPHLPEVTIDQALHGGDDYELCFTADFANRSVLDDIKGVTRIGQITQEKNFNFELNGFKHF